MEVSRARELVNWQMSTIYPYFLEGDYYSWWLKKGTWYLCRGGTRFFFFFVLLSQVM